MQALSDDGGTSPATVSQLYALQNDGTMTVVSVAEVPDGGTVATSAQIRPLGVHDTVKYTLLQYSVLGGDDRYVGVRVRAPDGSSTQCPFVAARKSDSALYCVPRSSRPFCEPREGEVVHFAVKLFEADVSGDLIYMNSCTGLGRLDFASPSSPIFNWLTDLPDLQHGGFVSTFVVNSDGDAAIVHKPEVTSHDNQIRIYLRGGGFRNIAVLRPGGGCLTSGVGGAHAVANAHRLRRARDRIGSLCGSACANSVNDYPAKRGAEWTGLAACRASRQRGARGVHR